MAGITTFLDESKMPNRTQEQKLFDNLMAAVFQNFPKWGREVNETLGALNALAAGGVYAIPYVFDTATADADPGPGKLRLSAATQNSATVMRLDLTASGQDYATLIDTMDGSTSFIKGSIRLVKQGDLSKWMTFDVTARAAPTGYRNLAVACTDSSAASPFVAGDALMLFFQRNGDKGDVGTSGLVPLASATIASSVATIDFLNVFSTLYDKYTIEIQGLLGTMDPSVDGSTTRLQLAYGGQADSSAAGYRGNVSNGLSLGGAFKTSAATLTIEIRNTNTSDIKSVGIRGFSSSTNSDPVFVMSENCHKRTGLCSGFRIVASGTSAAVPFTAGTIRIFGNRNF